MAETIPIAVIEDNLKNDLVKGLVGEDGETPRPLASLSITSVVVWSHAPSSWGRNDRANLERIDGERLEEIRAALEKRSEMANGQDAADFGRLRKEFSGVRHDVLVMCLGLPPRSVM